VLHMNRATRMTLLRGHVKNELMRWALHDTPLDTNNIVDDPGMNDDTIVMDARRSTNAGRIPSTLSSVSKRRWPATGTQGSPVLASFTPCTRSIVLRNPDKQAAGASRLSDESPLAYTEMDDHSITLNVRTTACIFVITIHM